MKEKPEIEPPRSAVIQAEDMRPEDAITPVQQTPSQHAHIQASSTTLNLSTTAEAALIQRLSPENITAVIRAGSDVQKAQIQLAEKELDAEQTRSVREHEAEQARSIREHERRMKRLEHSGHNETSIRRLAAGALAIVAFFVIVTVLREQYALAGGIIASLTSGALGFLGGRSYEKLKPPKDE